MTREAGLAVGTAARQPEALITLLLANFDSPVVVLGATLDRSTPGPPARDGITLEAILQLLTAAFQQLGARNFKRVPLQWPSEICAPSWCA